MEEKYFACKISAVKTLIKPAHATLQAIRWRARFASTTSFIRWWTFSKSSRWRTGLQWCILSDSQNKATSLTHSSSCVSSLEPSLCWIWWSQFNLLTWVRHLTRRAENRKSWKIRLSKRYKTNWTKKKKTASLKVKMTTSGWVKNLQMIRMNPLSQATMKVGPKHQIRQI